MGGHAGELLPVVLSGLPVLLHIELRTSVLGTHPAVVPTTYSAHQQEDKYHIGSHLYTPSGDVTPLQVVSKHDNLTLRNHP
jgi:hypothetical protein